MRFSQRRISSPDTARQCGRERCELVRTAHPAGGSFAIGARQNVGRAQLLVFEKVRENRGVTLGRADNKNSPPAAACRTGRTSDESRVVADSKRGSLRASHALSKSSALHAFI